MDIHQLELFLAVMDSPSMTRAAEKIHLSPGAVSLQLHNLAEELHTELFVRRGKRLVPTPAALRLAEHAKEVIKRMGHIRQEFENDLSTDVRPFHFATGVTTLIYQLGGPLRQLRKRYPNAEIRVTVGVTEEMVAGLLDRRFDLALISLPVAEDNLSITPLFDEELLVVRPSANKVGSGHVGSLRPSDLNAVPFLLYPRRRNGTAFRSEGRKEPTCPLPTLFAEGRTTRSSSSNRGVILRLSSATGSEMSAKSKRRSSSPATISSVTPTVTRISAFG